MIYHITSKNEWEQAKKLGEYSPASLREDGFIHCSNKYQLWLVATFLYKGKKDLLILYIDERRLKSKLVFEDLKRHGEFPHIYGPLNIYAVTKTPRLKFDKQGNFLLPRGLE